MQKDGALDSITTGPPDSHKANRSWGLFTFSFGAISISSVILRKRRKKDFSLMGNALDSQTSEAISAKFTTSKSMRVAQNVHFD